MSELDKKISELPSVTSDSLTATDKVPVVASGVTSFISAQELRDYVSAGLGGELTLDVGLALEKTTSTQGAQNRLSIQAADQSPTGTGTAEVQIIPSPAVNQAGMNAQLIIYGKTGTDYSRFAISQIASELRIDSTANFNGLVRNIPFIMGGYESYQATGKARAGQNAMILVSDASVRLRGSEQTVAVTGSEAGGTYGSERTTLYDFGDTGDSRLIIGTRQSSGTDNANDFAGIQLTRGNVTKWLTGLNAGGADADSYDFYAAGANRMSVGQDGTVTATAFVGDGSGLTNLPGGGGGGSYLPLAGGSLTGRTDIVGSSALALFDVYNSNSAGFGLKVRVANSLISNDQYAFSVKSGDDAQRAFSVYADDYIAQLGPTPPAIQWYTAGVAPAAASGGSNAYTRYNRLLIASKQDDSGLVMVSNVTANPASYAGGPNQQANIGLVGANSQGKIRMNMVTASSDGGWRFYSNIKQDWTQADTNRGTMKWGTDSGNRFFGFGYMKPGDSTYSSITSWSDDGVERDFQLFIAPGGNNTTDWGAGKYAEIFTVKVNKGIDFGTQTSAGYDYTTVKTALRIEPGAGGTEGTVESKGYFWCSAPAGGRMDGTFYLTGGSSSKAPLEIPAGAPASPSNNQIWFVGDVMYRRIGGVTKSVTFT